MWLAQFWVSVGCLGSNQYWENREGGDFQRGNSLSLMRNPMLD